MKKLFCLLAVLLSAGASAAQTLGTGAYNFASFDNKGFDAINLGNLNTRFSVPIVNRTGRGMGFNYAIQNEGLIWTPSASGSSMIWVPDPTWGFSGLLNGTAFAGYLTHKTFTRSCPRPRYYQGPPPTKTVLTSFVYHDAFGGLHGFNYTNTGPCPATEGDEGSITGDGSAVDGSGYKLYYENQVTTRTGSLITPASSATGADNASIVDANGNTINSSGGGSFTDTLGATALTISGGNPQVFTYPVTLQSNSATTASASVTYQSYTVQTNFQCSGIGEYSGSSIPLVDRITLADGAYYAFTYEPTPGVSGAVTARIASITLPTGGVISYAYSGGCNGSGINADGTTASLTRTTSDGTKTYTRSGVSATMSTTATVDEKNNTSVYTFEIAGDSSQFYLETHHRIFAGTNVSGGDLEDYYTCYNGASAPCDGVGITLPITEADTVVSHNNGAQLVTQNSYGPSGLLVSSAQSQYGTALQSTAYTYNNFGEILTAVTKDGSNNSVSSVTYGYDETAVVSTSGVPQHTTYACPCGNLTSTHVSTGSGTLTTTQTNYDTGSVATITAPDGGQTSYSYDTAQAVPTTTTLPTPASGVALSTSATFDATAAAVLSSTGMNTNESTTVNQYDARLRPTQVTLPSGSVINYTYDLNHVYAVQTLDSGRSSKPSYEYDGYGRLSRVENANGESTNPWDHADYCYDAAGLLQFQPTAYQDGVFSSSTKRCSGAGTSYTYDALGRVLSVTTPDGPATAQYFSRAVKTIDVMNVARITQYDR